MTASAPHGDLLPFISVISIVYNHERYVAEAIESVLAQDWPSDRIEHIVVDDGSSDRSAEIVAEYAGRVPWLRLIRQSNQGVRAAVNRAMEEARGELICGVSGDDALRPEKLAVQARAMMDNPSLGMIYSDMEIIDGAGASASLSFQRTMRLPTPSGRPTGILMRQNFVSGGGVMLRGALKPVFHPIPSHAAWEDYWWVWAISRVSDIAYLDVPTYRYRQHGANLAFGAQGAGLTNAQRHELRFRRWMLGDVEPHEADANDLLVGIGMYLRLISLVAQADGTVPEVIVTVDAAQAEQADAYAASVHERLAQGDRHGAAFALARAASADPHRHDLAPLAEAVRGTPAVAVPAASPLSSARRFITLADADELVAEPGLLRAYAQTFGPHDDATLLIHAADWSDERIAAELVPLVDACCPDEQRTPDLLAHRAPAAERATLMASAGAILTAAATGVSGPPRVDAAGVPGLAAGIRRQAAA